MTMEIMSSPIPPSASTISKVLAGSLPEKKYLVCSLDEIIAQFSGSEGQHQCLASTLCVKSGETNRCSERCLEFRWLHKYTFNDAMQVLDMDPMTADRYKIVIRKFFCPEHMLQANFDNYIEAIKDSWTEGDEQKQHEVIPAIRRMYEIDEESEIMRAIRRMYEVEEESQSLMPPSLPIWTRSEERSPVAADRLQTAFTYSSQTTPGGIGNASKRFPSALLSTPNSTTVGADAEKERRTGRTRSSSNPFPHSSSTEGVQNSSHQRSDASCQNAPHLPLLSVGYRAPTLSQTPETSPDFSNSMPRSSGEYRDIPVGTVSESQNEQENVSRADSNDDHPQARAMGLGQKDSATGAIFGRASGSLSSLSKSTFEFRYPMRDFAPSPCRTVVLRDATDLRFEAFDAAYSESSASTKHPSKTTEKAETQRPDAYPELGPIIGSEVANESHLEAERDLSNSVLNTDCCATLNSTGPPILFQPVGDENNVSAQPEQLLQSSKDDTGIEERQEEIVRPLAPSLAETNPQISAVSSPGKEYPLKIDCNIRNEILKNLLNNEGYVYILKAPLYAKKYFPGETTMVKIGIAKSIEGRMKTLRTKCRIGDLEEVPDQWSIPFRNFAKAERLVQAELKNFQRVFKCGCQKNHREWFAVTEEVALDAVRRWRTFMLEDPYDKRGVLKTTWSKKLADKKLPKPGLCEQWNDSKERSERWNNWLKEGIALK